MIVTPIIFLVLLSSFLAAYFSIRNGTRAVNSVSIALRSDISLSIQTHMEHFFSVPQTICTINSNLIARGILDPGEPLEMEQWFLGLVHVYPQVSSIYFGNLAGGLVNAGREPSDSLFYVISTDSNKAGTFWKLRVDGDGYRTGQPLSEIPDFDARTRFWYTNALDSPGELTVTEPFRVFTGDDFAISTSCAVTGSQGELLGVVSCDVFLSRLSNFLDNIQIGVSGFAFITDCSGIVLAQSSVAGQSETSILLPATDSSDELIRITGTHINTSFGSISSILSPIESQFDYNGMTYFTSVSPFEDISGKPYYIVVVIPESDFMGFIKTSNKDTAILLALSLIAAIALGFLVAALVSKPILTLHSAVRELTDGAEEDFPPHWMREVNELSMAFNKLTRQLKASMNELREEISERIAAEKALKESEERMDLALRGTGAATWDWNLTTGRITVNSRYAEMLGYSPDEIEPVTEKVWRNLSNPEDMKLTDIALHEHFEGHSSLYESSFRMKHRDGRWIWVIDRGKVLEWDSEGKPRRMAGTHVDITRSRNAEMNQQRLQNQLNKTRELESIGQLAGGVAHDLNNLLTPVIGYTEILLEDPGSRSESRPFTEILKAARSAQQLVNQLLAFGRKQHLQLEVIDLNSVIMNYQGLMRRTIRENIEIIVTCHDEPLPVEGDSSKIEQVLMNLAVNAQDAMPRGGWMKVQTSRSNFPAASPENEPGAACAVLEVFDNGSGMDTELLGKIFEPFFTTKGIRGTGLGLSTVYGIVSQHGGVIDVESKLGRGSVFRVLLPLSLTGFTPEGSSETPKGTVCKETILLVEDSSEVREITRIALERLGYTVVEADCGAEALEVLKNRGKAIDLMLSDVIMPGISLDELHRDALVLVPELKIIYMSGYSDDNIKREGQPGKSTPFISKPFSLSDLASVVKSVLNQST